MAISGLGPLISTLMKWFRRKLQDEVAPKNLESGKTLSEASSQRHAGVTQRPMGDRSPHLGLFHRYRPGIKQASSSFPPR